MKNPVSRKDIRELDGEGLSGQLDFCLLEKHDLESDHGVSEAQVRPQPLELGQVHSGEYENEVDIGSRAKLPLGRRAEENRRPKVTSAHIHGGGDEILERGSDLTRQIIQPVFQRAHSGIRGLF
jgi:hypothetical protein